MTYEEIEAKLGELERARDEITKQMVELHKQRGAAMDDKHAEALVSGLTESQREAVVRHVTVKPAAIHAWPEVPAAEGG